MLRLTFIDTESTWDEVLHEDYRSLNPRKHQHHRMASKRIFAAAALDVSIGADGTTSIGGVSSWTEHEHGDEAATVTGLFDHLRFRPDTKAVTWGGLAADLPLLTMAAMEHQLTLPEQLRAGQRPRWGEMRQHTDLALELKGQGRDWAHLSELGLRLGFPKALFTSKSRIDLPRNAEEWASARSHVEFDTVLTAMVCLSWLRAQGRISGDRTAMTFQLADWFLRARNPDEAIGKSLAALRRLMGERIKQRLLEAA